MNPLIERTGWTLLHSLWEGGLIWAGLQLALLALRRQSAQSRYLAGCAALALAVLLPLATFLYLGIGSEHSPGATGSTVMTGSSVGLLPVADLSAPSIGREGSLQDEIEPALPWIVLCWVLGCIWEALKLTTDCVNTGRLMTEKLQPLPETIMRRCQELAHRLGIGRVVRLGESLLVDVPSVVGWLKPVILVPVGAFSGLSGVQIDALLAHELAHISRHDFLVNILQSICEVGFFFNPAVLAINGCIRRERENACDDVAVALTGAPLAYASALTQLEEARQPKLVLAASGGQGELFGRIRRLAGGSPTISSGARIWIAFVLALLVAGGTGYWQLQAPKVYSATATLQFDKPNTVVTDQGVTDPTARTEFDINTYLQDMQSNKMREMVVDSLTPEERRILLRPYVKYLPPGQPAPAVGGALGSLTFEPVRNSFLIRVSDTHLDPEAAAIVANRYADKFMDYLMDSVAGKNEYSAQYLQDRSEQLRKEFEVVQVKLEESRRQGVAAGFSGGESAAAKAARDSLEIQASVAENNYRAILNRLSQVRTSKNIGQIPLHVLDTASPNYAPIRPVISVIVRSCLSLGIAVFAVVFVVLTAIDYGRRRLPDGAAR